LREDILNNNGSGKKNLFEERLGKAGVDYRRFDESDAERNIGENQVNDEKSFEGIIKNVGGIPSRRLKFVPNGREGGEVPERVEERRGVVPEKPPIVIKQNISLMPKITPEPVKPEKPEEELAKPAPENPPKTIEREEKEQTVVDMANISLVDSEVIDVDGKPNEVVESKNNDFVRFDTPIEKASNADRAADVLNQDPPPISSVGILDSDLEASEKDGNNQSVTVVNNKLDGQIASPASGLPPKDGQDAIMGKVDEEQRATAVVEEQEVVGPVSTGAENSAVKPEPNDPLSIEPKEDIKDITDEVAARSPEGNASDLSSMAMPPVSEKTIGVDTVPGISTDQQLPVAKEVVSLPQAETPVVVPAPEDKIEEPSTAMPEVAQLAESPAVASTQEAEIEATTNRPVGEEKRNMWGWLPWVEKRQKEENPSSSMERKVRGVASTGKHSSDFWAAQTGGSENKENTDQAA